jgi:hypothetical protein
MVIVISTPASASGLLPLHDAQVTRVVAELCDTRHIQVG